MKIAIVGSPGGHLTELRMILSDEVIGDNEFFIITEGIKRTKDMKKTYLFKPLTYNPFPFIPAFFKSLKILKKEKPELVVTSGAEIGVPVLVAAKILHIKTIFIDDMARVETPTLAGKFCYPFSDIFLVQHPEMVKKYGKRTRYEGGIV